MADIEPEASDREVKANMEGVFKIVRIVGSNDSCHRIGHVLRQITGLSEENERLVRGEEANLVQISKHSQQLSDKDRKLIKKDGELSESKNKQQETADTVAGIKEEVKKHEKEACESLAEKERLIQQSKKHEKDALILEKDALILESSNKAIQEELRKVDETKQQLKQKSDKLNDVENWVPVPW